MRAWIQSLNAVYRVMRWLVLTLLVGGLLIGVVIFGPLANIITTGKPQVTDPRSWPSAQWIAAHLALSVGLALAILVLFGLSWLAHFAARSALTQSAVPASSSASLLQRLRYLPHHRAPAVVLPLDWIYHATLWMVGVLIIGGVGVSAFVDFITTGTVPITEPQQWAIIRLVLAHVWPSVAVGVVLVALIASGALAHSVAHPEIGFSRLSRFRAACKSAVEGTIKQIPKYDASLYVQRSGVNQEFEQFLRSPSPCLLVLGAAGMGKTNLLCEMARERAARAPTLLLRGVASMEGDLGFWQVVAESLSVKAKRNLDAARVRDMLDDALHVWNTDLVIFVDGINENARIDQLRLSLAAAAQAARGTSIRICMSCRDVDWHAFSQEQGLVAQLYQPDETSAGASQGVTIGEFTDDEFAQAWAKYSRYYQLMGDLSDRLTQICHHPLMLSFLCLAFKGRAVPPGVHRKEIFDEYWKEKLTNRYGVSTENALLKLVANMYRQRYVEIPQRVAVEVIGPEAEYNRLLDEAVIIYARTDRAGQQQVQFTYDAFFEYALARYLLDAWGWATRDTYDVLGDLHGLFAQADQYRFVQGSLQYLLLYLTTPNPNRSDALAASDRAAALAFLLELAKLELADKNDTRWKVFFCDFATKVDEPTVAERLTPMLRRFANDRDSFVRWSAGAAIGVLALRSASADTLLREIEQSAEWKERETAAVALGQLYRDFAPLSERLERLADDINWRVRRQVGNTLDDLCRLAPSPAFDLLRRWAAPSSRWRLRRAVVQARIGLLKNRELALDLLPELAHDEVEEIRWRTVSDLANLVMATSGTSIPAQVLPLLHALSRDDTSIWVRRHVAFWLPDLHQVVGAKSNEIAEGLLGDGNRDVRWETARALGSLKDKLQAEAWLTGLEGDPDAQVRFATRYSRAALRPPEERPLAALLESPDEQVRLQAQEEQLARSSRVLVKPSGEDILSAAKPDRFTSIQDVLQRGTETLGPDQMRTLFTLLRKDEDEGIRWAAASLLASVKVFDTRQQDVILQDFIADSHYWVRRESLTAFEKMMRAGFRPSKELAGQVIVLTADIEPEVRWAALCCLQGFQQVAEGSEPYYPSGAISQALNARLDDSDRQVRQLAESLQASMRAARE